LIHFVFNHIQGEKRRGKMLAKLKEYKEIISLVIFFLGGVFWIQNQFPNKEDLASVRCLLNGYMKLTQLQIRSQELDKKRYNLSQQLTGAPSNNGSNDEIEFSPAMMMELEQLKADYKNTQDEFRQTNLDMTELRDELQRGVCEGGSQ